MPLGADSERKIRRVESTGGGADPREMVAAHHSFREPTEEGALARQTSGVGVVEQNIPRLKAVTWHKRPSSQARVGRLPIESAGRSNVVHAQPGHCRSSQSKSLRVHHIGDAQLPKSHLHLFHLLL